MINRNDQCYPCVHECKRGGTIGCKEHKNKEWVRRLSMQENYALTMIHQ